MTSLAPYAFYILAAYGLGALCLGTLLGATLYEIKKINRALRDLGE